MHIGDVQERDVAEGGQIVELGGRLGVGCARPQARPRRRGEGISTTTKAITVIPIPKRKISGALR